ncbi:MAG: chaperone modulator CbpM [Candidatus Dormibacteraceae bacterium]
MPDGRRADPLVELAEVARVEVAAVRRYQRAGCIEITEAGITDLTVRRARQVHRLRRDLGLQLDAIAIIVRLIDRLERAQPPR